MKSVDSVESKRHMEAESRYLFFKNILANHMATFLPDSVVLKTIWMVALPRTRAKHSFSGILTSLRFEANRTALFRLIVRSKRNDLSIAY